VQLFLSYADEDIRAAEGVARWFQGQGHEVIPGGRGDAGADDPGGSLENSISRADAFLALMTPAFLASPACRREREVALLRESRRAEGQPQFVHVLEAQPTPYHEAGALRARRWYDMTEPRRDAALSGLLLILLAAAGSGRHAEDSAPPEPPKFRNREEELDDIVEGLTSDGGIHFWRVTAQPRLGKSWFLDQIGIRLLRHPLVPWTVKLVDVSEKPPEVRTSAEALLGMLFGIGEMASVTQETILAIARRVIRGRRPHLCLLDGVELLDKETSVALRGYLSRIYLALDKGEYKGIRLSVIVASRGEGDRWAGISPSPRLRPCPLSEFKPEIVEEALTEVLSRLGRSADDSRELKRQTGRLHQLSEGLPVLLYRYLCWIHEDLGIGLDSLHQQFDAITQPYIEQELLMPGSLLDPGVAATGLKRQVVKDAIRALVPYRVISRAHLNQHLGRNGALLPALAELHWSTDKLWQEVSRTDLFCVPQPEIWDVIYPPVRRLLCRYWYPGEDSQLELHREAEEFVRAWAGGVVGSDQAVPLAEILWHRSQVLRLSHAASTGDRLAELTRKLTLGLVESETYPLDRLRELAANRVAADAELAIVLADLSVPVDRLTDVIVMP
jgi:hypothetical protein